MLRRRSLPAVLGTILLAGLGLSGCATGSTEAAETPDAVTRADAQAFPVTIEHAFGSTTITEEPKRVATLGWSDQDAALALGVVPVGATKLTWGGNSQGSSDWFDAALEEVGGEPARPVRRRGRCARRGDRQARPGPDPGHQLRHHPAGVPQAQQDRAGRRLPGGAVGDAVADVAGRRSARPWAAPARAEEVAAETQQEIDAAKEEYPQLAGASFIFAYLTTTDLSTVGIYAPEDPRVSFLHDLGLVDAPAVAGAIKPGQFYGTVSAERAGDLDSDVLLTWSESTGDLQKFADDRLIGKIPALASDHAYAEEDKHVSLAVTNPTPLSIPFVIERFVPEVAKAVDGS